MRYWICTRESPSKDTARGRKERKETSIRHGLVESTRWKEIEIKDGIWLNRHGRGVGSVQTEANERQDTRRKERNVHCIWAVQGRDSRIVQENSRQRREEKSRQRREGKSRQRREEKSRQRGEEKSRHRREKPRSRDTGVRSREAEAPASSRDTGARSRDNNARRTGTTVQEAKTSVRGEPRHLCEKNRDVGDGVRGTETSVREEPRRQHKKNQDKRDDARQERRCKAKREKYISSVKEGDAGSVQRETESKGTQEVSVVPGSVEGTRCWIRIGRR